MADYGASDTSTTSLGTNQFPISEVYVPNVGLKALGGGPKQTDGTGKDYASALMYVQDGQDVAQGQTTDAANANTVIGQLKQIKTNTASVVIGSGTLTANIGTTGGLALDTSINGVIVAQGSTTSGQKGTLTQGAVTASAPTYTTGQTSPLSLTTAGALRVDNSASTQPVSGTFWQATQPVSGTVTANAGSGTFTNQQSNITTDYDTGAGTQTMTMFGVALPASGGSVAGGTATNPLRTDPTGTTTQPVSGTITANAGTGNFNNASVGATGAAVPASASYLAGNKSGNLTGISLDGSGNLNVNVAAGGGSGGTSSSFNATFPATGTATGASDGTNMKPLLVDASGFLKVNVSAGGGSGGTSSSFGSAFPATGTASGFSDGTNMQGARAFDADTGAGTQYVAGANLRLSASGGSIEAKGQQTMTNSIPVTLASDQGAVPVSGTFWQATQPVSGTITANAGTGPFPVAGMVASGASNANNPVKVGGAFNTTQPTVTTGQVVDAQYSARGAALVATGTDTFNVTVNAALPTGSNVIGHVIADSGSTTAVTQATASNLNAQVQGAAASGAAQAGNPVKVGGVFNTTQPTVTTGQAVDAQMTARGAQIVATGTDTFNVTVNAALPTGGNTIGAVTQASGPWTSNVTQFGGNNVATGTGAGGTGIPRMTVSNDSQIQVWDGTTGPVAAKAAGTPPALADISHVHSISPNNTGLPVNTSKIVQKTNNKSSGSVASLAVAFGSNNLAGNSIVVVCAVGNGTAPTITDTLSNTYTQATQIANGTALNTAVFFAVNIAAGANTVTVNNGGTTASIAMEMYEVSGLITQVTAQPSVTASATGSSGTAATSNVGALSPNEYAFAGVGVGTAAQTITAGAGWTNDSGQQNPTTPAGLFSFVSMSQFLGSLKAVTPQATFTSEPWAIAVATFRPVLLGIEGTVNQAGAATGTKASVASSASSVTLLAANASRKGAMVYNDSTAILYLDLSGGTASTSSYSTQVGTNVLFELPGPAIYTGAITGIWASAVGNARITEFS